MKTTITFSRTENNLPFKTTIAKCFLVLLLVFGVNSAFAATYYSKASGNANLTATWGLNVDGTGSAPGGFVTSGDLFILRSAATLSLSNIWTIGTGVTLQVDGILNVTGNSDDVIINGIIVFTGTTVNQITLTGGGNGNDFTLASGATLKTANPNGIRGTNCSLPTSASGIIGLSTAADYEFNGATQATTGLPTGLTAKLTINSSATVTLSAAQAIGNGGSIDLTAGIFAAGTNLTMSAATSTINRTGGSMTGTIQGATNGTYNVNYTGNSKTTGPELSGNGLNTIDISVTAGQTVTLDQNRLPDGNLSVTVGTLNLSTFTINRSSVGGTLAVSNGATLKIGGTTTFPANYTNHTLGASSTIDYFGTAQTITAETYGNLTLSTSGTKTMPPTTTTVAGNFTTSGTISATAAAVVNVTGSVTLGSGTTFNAASFTHTIGSNWTNNGATFAPATSTIVFNGSAQTIGGSSSTPFNNLSLSGGTKTFGLATAISGNLSIASGALANFGSITTCTTGTLTLGGLGTIGSAKFGSTSTSATGTVFKNNTYFTASTTGYITVSTSSCVAPTITFSSIPNICVGSLSYALPYTAVSGAPDLYTISGTRITSVTNGTLNAPSSSITVGLKSAAAVGTISPSAFTVESSVTGCVSNNLSGTVTVIAAPNAGADGAVTICAGSTVTLSQLNTAITGEDVGGTWTPALAGAGTYTYTVNATSPCTVADTSIVVVTAQAQPNAGADGAVTICAGSTVTLSQLNTAITGEDVGGTWTPALAGAGTYTYTVNATSPCTVADTSIVLVTAQAQPNAGADGAVIICAGSTVTLSQLNAAITGEDVGGTWTPALAGAGTYTYTVNATSPCTVADTSIVLVTAQAQPNAGADGAVTICAGSTVTLSQLNTAITGEDVGGTWTPALAGAGTYTYTVNATSPCTVADTSIVLVTAQAQPNAGADGAVTICAGSTVTLSQLNTAITGEDVGGTWTPALAGAGTYTYTVNATSPCTVADTSLVVVTAQAQPNAGADGAVTICAGSTVTLSQLNTAITGEDLGGTWTPALAGAGTYTYTVNATSPCTLADTSIVLVTELAIPIVTASDVSGCSGSSITLVGSGSPAGGSGVYSPSSPFVGSSSTTYRYTYTAPNGCTVTSALANIIITAQPTWYLDVDGDHYYSGSAVSSCTSPGAGYTTTGILGGGDCNDGNPAINPGAVEICYNTIDDNCDGNSSEGCAAIPITITSPAIISNFSNSFSCSVYNYAGATGIAYRIEIERFANGVSAGGPVTLPTQTSRFFQIPDNMRVYTTPTTFTTYKIRASAVINSEVVAYAVPVISVNNSAVPTIQLSTCPTALSSIGATISANPGFNATDYSFRIRLDDSNPSPTYYYITNSLSRFVNSNSFVGFQLQFGMSYKVSVSYHLLNHGVLEDAGWGAECTMTTPTIPVTTLSAPACGTQAASLGSPMTASPALYATVYIFRLRLTSDTGPSPTYYYTTELPSRFSQLSAFQGITLSYNTNYSISVQYRMPNRAGSVLSAFGPECTILTPFFPTVEIVCNSGTTALTQSIAFASYPGFPNYRIKLQELDGNNDPIVASTQYIVRNTNNFTLSMFTTFPPTLGKSYNASVAIILGAEQDQFGRVCTITTASGGRAVAIKQLFKAVAYPNPFANNFMLDVKTSSESVVSLKVYDMIGRLIEQRNVKVSEIETTSIGDRYPSGVYNVVVSQEDNVQMVRVVKR